MKSSTLETFLAGFLAATSFLPFSLRQGSLSSSLSLRTAFLFLDFDAGLKSSSLSLSRSFGPSTLRLLFILLSVSSNDVGIMDCMISSWDSSSSASSTSFKLALSIGFSSFLKASFLEKKFFLLPILENSSSSSDSSHVPRSELSSLMKSESSSSSSSFLALDVSPKLNLLFSFSESESDSAPFLNLSNIPPMVNFFLRSVTLSLDPIPSSLAVNLGWCLMPARPLWFVFFCRAAKDFLSYPSSGLHRGFPSQWLVKMRARTVNDLPNPMSSAKIPSTFKEPIVNEIL